MPKTKLGKVSISPKGEWNKTAVYEQLDLVTYNGGSWLCTFPNTAQAPTKGEYWTQIAAKGDTGAKGDPGTAEASSGLTVTGDATISGALTVGGTNVQLEEKFEQIATFTVEEDVTTFKQTFDKCKHVIGVIDAPMSSTTTGSLAYFGINGSCSLYYYLSHLSYGGTEGALTLNKLYAINRGVSWNYYHNTIVKCYSTSNNSTTTYNLIEGCVSMRMNTLVSEIPYINSISLTAYTGTKLIPAGTTITIYGARA